MISVYSWNTTKNSEGFIAIATLISEGSFKTLKSAGPFKTRARAKSHAVKMMKYYRSQQAQA